MGVRNGNQIAKELVKRMRVLKDQKKAAAREIANLPEVEKLQYDISILTDYINRYKNDVNTPMSVNKVKLYTAQKEVLLAKLKTLEVEDGQGKSI